MKEEEITATQPSDSGAGALTFEDFRNQNGMTYWWASDVCLMLGYKDVRRFFGVILRVNRDLMRLGLDPFRHIERVERGRQVDYKLTYLVCRLAIKNGDPRKPEVKRAQRYFRQDKQE